MNPKLLLLVWTNRARIYAAAKGLHWSRRTWTRLGIGAAVALGIYWITTQVRIVGPSSWPPVQWVLIAVNVVGFVWLYLLMRSWFATQDDVWDEVNRLRGEVAALAQHEHDIVEVDTDVVPTPEVPTAELPIEGTEQRELGGRVFTFVKG